MKGGENQVAGLSSGQRRGDRLEVSHLADQNNVGVLAQRRTKAEGEVWRIEPISRWLTIERLWP